MTAEDPPLEPITLTIKDWPVGERPREKLLTHGPRPLGDAELVAILIGSGTRGATAVDLAQRLLHFSHGLSGIARLSPEALQRHRGVGSASAARIAAAMEIGRRLASQEAGDSPRLTTPEAVADRFGPQLRDLRHELFKVVLLDGANRLIRDVDITRGLLNASLVHPREVFKTAVDFQAAGVILVHNHPSGEASPSPEDRRVTAQLVQAGQIMGIPVLDHVIVAGTRHFSFAKAGILSC